jgi:chromosome segregation ATPase
MMTQRQNHSTEREKMSKSHLEQIAKLHEQRQKMESEYNAQVRQLLHGAIEEKEKEVAEAREKVKEAEKALEQLESDLDALREEAGLGARRGARRTGRRPSGKLRKSRVSIETKREAVAELLQKLPRGVEFSQLKAALLDIKLPDSNSNIFATADFNSSLKFGERYLPQGWTIVGERRNAKVQRG